MKMRFPSMMISPASLQSDDGIDGGGTTGDAYFAPRIALISIFPPINATIQVQRTRQFGGGLQRAVDQRTQHALADG